MPEDRLRRSLLQTVSALSSAMAMREDQQTPDHHSNCAQIARTIAQMMDLSPDEVDGIRIGATLHDYGKVGIPMSILTKPSQLDEHEFGIVRQHPVIGFQILKNIDFPWPVAQMVLQHHERLDGSGYPAGLKGDEIIKGARIIAVADVVDAMLTDKPYRAAKSIDEAMRELRDLRGTQFDADIVDTCIDLYLNHQDRLDPSYYGRDE